MVFQGKAASTQLVTSFTTNWATYLLVLAYSLTPIKGGGARAKRGWARLGAAERGGRSLGRMTLMMNLGQMMSGGLTVPQPGPNPSLALTLASTLTLTVAFIPQS